MLRSLFTSCGAFFPNHHFQRRHGYGAAGQNHSVVGMLEGQFLRLRARLGGESSHFMPLMAASCSIQLHNYHLQLFYSNNRLYQPGHSIF